MSLALHKPLFLITDQAKHNDHLPDIVLVSGTKM